MCRQAADLGQIRDLPEGVGDLALRHFMGDHNDLSARFAGIELHDGLNGHPACAEATPHVSDHTRGIQCVETHIVALSYGPAVRQNAGAPAVSSQQGIDATGGVTGLTNSGDVENVGDNG